MGSKKLPQRSDMHVTISSSFKQHKKKKEKYLEKYKASSFIVVENRCK
jgi:hypothetical protein